MSIICVRQTFVEAQKEYAAKGHDGKSAKHGVRSYVVNGEMCDGSAVIAFPAVYRVSGVMTFIVNQDGVVYEKDLGSETEKIAAEITQFDPDSGWEKVN